MSTEVKREIIKRAPDIIKRNLRFKDPITFNLDLVMSGDYSEVWVLPIFLPAGKQDYIIRAPKDQEISDHIKRNGRESIRLQSY